jgi:hypothetical protein
MSDFELLSSCTCQILPSLSILPGPRTHKELRVWFASFYPPVQPQICVAAFTRLTLSLYQNKESSTYITKSRFPSPYCIFFSRVAQSVSSGFPRGIIINSCISATTFEKGIGHVCIAVHLHPGPCNQSLQEVKTANENAYFLLRRKFRPI